MLIEDFDTYLLAAEKLQKNSSFIYISSFGFYAGISSYGNENLNKQGAFCIKHKSKLNLLVGTSFTKCYPECLHCLEIENKKKKYLELTKIKIPTLKIVEKLHMKTFLTESGCIVGGINFTDSNWCDYSILLKNTHPDYKKIKIKFENEYENAKEVDLKSTIKFQKERIISFGKYKDKKLSDVIKADPEYINWCVENIPGFKLNYNL